MLRHNRETNQVDYYQIVLDDVVSTSQKPEEPMLFESASGTFLGACIKCARPNCVSYYEGEYLCSDIEGFPANNDNNVCPTHAIYWLNTEQEITIDQNKCIGCGVCAQRCPFGAIYFNESGTPKINTDRTDNHFARISSGEDYPTIQKNLAERIETITTNRTVRKGTSKEILEVYDALRSDGDTATLLCRNVFISLGFDCAIRRVGDVYTRMDAVYSNGNVKGPIEMEFQSDTLSSVRNLLDDLAMLRSRYNQEVDELTPVALCLFIPNTRQGFFQDCDDIKKILGIEIRTITLGALLAMLWNDARLDFSKGAFSLSFRDTSIKDDLDAMVGHSVPADINGTGLYDSAK